MLPHGIELTSRTFDVALIGFTFKSFSLFFVKFPSVLLRSRAVDEAGLMATRQFSSERFTVYALL